MTLREASRRVVDANRARQDCTSLTEAVERDIEFQIAMRDLERATSDDAPPPRDLAAMCKSILMDPYGGK